MNDDVTHAGKVLGERLKNLRKSRGMTLNDVANVSGVAASTVSKIENGSMSPTYGNLLRLAKGLGVGISELLVRERTHPVTARRSLTRRGRGIMHTIGTHDYELLCTELTNKKMVPMLARIHAKSLKEVSGFNSHPGEEVMFVVSGEVVLHTEHYKPLRLKQGDCVYFDSTMGHICLRGTEREATVFWVCSDEKSVEALSDRRVSESAREDIPAPVSIREPLVDEDVYGVDAEWNPAG